MIPDRRQRLKEAAIHSIRAGKAEDALTTAKYLADEDATDAEAFQIQGLALAKLDRDPESVVALREAFRLAPTDVRHAYNLAGQLANMGQLEEARQLVREALRLDPTYADAQRLNASLSGESAVALSENHMLKFLKGRERGWKATAFALMGLGAILTVLMLINFPAAPVPGGGKSDIALKTDALSQITVLIYLISTPTTFLWMIVDLVDKQKRLIWLVPLTVCGVLGFNFAPLTLYYFVGRQIGEND